MTNEIVLHTSELASYDNIHEWLQEKLNLPEHYGRNLDALWDCLTAYIPLPTTILWHDDANIGEQYRTITDLFEEASGEIQQLLFGYLLEDDADNS